MRKYHTRFIAFRVVSIISFSLILCAFLTIFPLAEEKEIYESQWENSGAQELMDSLPDGTKQLLIDLGLDDFSLSSIIALQPNQALQAIIKTSDEKKGLPYAVAGSILGVLLLCCLLNGMRKLPESAALSTTYKTVGLLAVCTTLFVPLCGCIRDTCNAMESAFVFMGSFAPVYGAVIGSSGNPAIALSFQTVVLFVAQVMTAVLSEIATPLLTVSLGLGMAGGIDDTFPLHSISRFILRICTWTLGLFCTVFVGLLSLQTLVGTRADGVAIRAVRFSLANMVPVIGNAVSEAFGTVQNCLLVLRTTLGGLGVTVTGIMLLPALLQCGWWALLLSICSAVAESLSFPTLTGMLKLSADVVKALAGILTCGGLFLIISITVVTMAVNGIA